MQIPLRAVPALLLIFVFLFPGCRQPGTGERQKLEARIDSLQQALDNAYRPGLGEFMSAIQAHHEKLWFAGRNENWELADFEIHEIQEALDDISSYCKDRPEIQFLPMLRPAIDSLNISIGQKNGASFRQHYLLLTHTCNNCHQATHHAFNVIRVPESSGFPDQEFMAHRPGDQ
jgi:hypothetical protein